MGGYMKQPKKLTRKQKEILSRRYPSINQTLYGCLEDKVSSFVIVNLDTKETKEINY